MLLLTGCSFVNNSDLPRAVLGHWAFEPKTVLNLSRGGAGNFYIAQSILDNLHLADRVFVLWSGLNRIDIGLPLCHKPLLRSYDQFSETRNQLWFHSGGFGGSWHSHPKHRYADWIYDYLKAQYVALDHNYLNNRSLSVIASCLAVLEQRQIPYAFGFIYDIHQDYSNSHTALGSAVDISDPAYNLIPWHKCLRNTPFEFCKQHGLLSFDEFHPTAEGYEKWWLSVRDQVPFETPIARIE